MPTSRSRAAVDAWTTAASPNLNTGEGNWLRIQGSGTDTRFAFWHAKNPAPRGATIITATLHLFGVGSGGATFTADVQRVSGGWAESLIDDANQPGVTGTIHSLTQTQSVDGLEWVVPITGLIQTICNGAVNNGFRISTADTTEHRFYSANNPDFQPYLEVEWADIPDAPTELSPAGGSAVSIAKPWLLFNFHDPVGDDIAALQVQINPTNSFGSPAFDSGTVASSDPELDLSTTAYAGITVAAFAWWRVRVQNSALNWSPWSDPVQFTRTARGTLTLTSPSGGTITDPTPTIIWSLTGATQTGRRITVWDDADPGTPIFDTGHVTTTATSFTLPKGVITDEAVTYRIRVRLWDLLTRANTPGDPSHTEIVTTVTYADGAPTAPTSVTVSQVAAGQPHVALLIAIASAPDFFVIVRNGKIIDLVDPTTIVSGPNYRFVDRTAAPNVAYTYRVRAKVGATTGPPRAGTPNPFTFTVGDVWLQDWTTPGSGRLVPIKVELDAQTFAMDEVSGNYSPINGNRTISITQGQRGLSGHVIGRIVAAHGLTAAASVAAMLWFKNHPRNQLRMTLGAQNLRVEIQNVTLKPLHTSDSDARGVEFDFAAQDGPTQ